jgi:hypothetical protein
MPQNLYPASSFAGGSLSTASYYLGLRKIIGKSNYWESIGVRERR